MAEHTFTVIAPEISSEQLAAIASDLRLDVSRRVFPGSEVEVKVGKFTAVDPMAEVARNTAAVVQEAAEDEARAQLDVAPSSPAENPVRQKKHSLPEDVAKTEAARQAKVLKRAAQPTTPETGKQALREADHADASKKGGDTKKAAKNPAPKDEVVKQPEAAKTVPPHQVKES